MAYSNETYRNQYAGDGATQVFNYNFRIDNNNELLVYVADSTGAEVLKTAPTDYNVTGLGNDAGGTITMSVAPLATETLTIVRGIRNTQETTFPSTSVNLAHDRSVMRDQRLQEQLDRAIFVQTSVVDGVGFSGKLNIVNNESKYVRLNSAGTGLEFADGTTTPSTSGIGSLAGVSNNGGNITISSSDGSISVVADNVAKDIDLTASPVATVPATPAAKTANYTINVADNNATILVDASGGAIDITYPSSATLTSSWRNYVKRIDTSANIVRILPTGGNIDGFSELRLNNNDATCIAADGGTDLYTVSDNARDKIIYKNYLINGNFDMWQRGTSFTATGDIANSWIANIGTGGAPAATIGRVFNTLGAVADQPKYSLRFNQTAIATTTSPNIEQAIEGVHNLAGINVTISFDAKVASGTLLISPVINQHFGTGGTPSADVQTAGANITVTTALTRHSVTIAVPSIAGKTLGTNGDDYISAIFNFPLSTLFDIEIRNVKVESGTVATVFTQDIIGGLATNQVLQVQRVFTGSFASTTATIPLDNTIPQITEGAEIFNIAFTPLSASSTLYCFFSAHVGGSAGNERVVTFGEVGRPNCLATLSEFNGTNGSMVNLSGVLHIAAQSTSTRTYSLRYGVSAGTAYLNGQSAGALYGLNLATSLIIMEVL